MPLELPAIGEQDLIAPERKEPQGAVKLFSRLFARTEDPREAMRPLWHRIVEIAREKHWYAERGVADTVAGRFDMITAVLAMALIRMEREEHLTHASVFLTELFVEDMDGQLRESGVGDVVVGKHIGRLMAAMGGRLGAYREALKTEDNSALEAAIERNLTMAEGTSPAAAAIGLRALHDRLTPIAAEQLLAAEI